ncbi:MAG: TonB-dependent receptor [Pseudomonadota bacterium]
MPAQPLATAIAELAAETGWQISVAADLVENERSAAVSGTMAPAEALAVMIAGTDLRVDRVGSDGVVLRRQSGAARTDDEPLIMNDIVVTARRFEETLQDVPGSVFVLSDEEIERSNIDDLSDYTLRLPNINFIEGGTPTESEVSIRGISNIVQQSASGPAVGFYVDEVILNPTGSNTGIDPNLFDIERIEVAYGPQGTSFGRGTIGGAINIVTKKPTPEFEASIEAEGGNYPDGRIKATVNGSLTGDNLLMARLTAFGEISDGYIDLVNLDNFNGENSFGARLALRSEPTDRLTLDLSGSFDRTNFNQANVATVESIESGSGPLENFTTVEPDSEVSRALITFRGAYDFDFGTLISNTSYLRVTSDIFSDGEFLEADALTLATNSTETSIAQEFRLESADFKLPLAGTTSFVGGVNFSFSDEAFTGEVTPGPASPFPAPPGAAVVIDSTEEIFDLGVFGEFRFRPIEQLELAAGARFTRTKVSFEGEQIDGVGFFGGVVPFQSFEDTFSQISPRGSIKYDWTDNFSTYSAISTGFRAGGFNQIGPNFGLQFDEESAINFEGGFRSSWFDNRLQVNGSGFALFYEDIQLTSTDPTGTFIAVFNAAEARSIGAEISVQTRPVDNLFFGIDYGLTKAVFTGFSTAPIGDLSGVTLPNAPTHTLRVTAEYEHEILNNAADAFIRAEHSFTSGFTNLVALSDPTFEPFDSRNVVNFRAGVRAERWELEAFVENAFDARYQTGSTGGAGLAPLFGESPAVEVGPSRRYGLRGRILF